MAPRVFNDDELDKTLKELRFERRKEEEYGARRKVRRLKKGSCSTSFGKPPVKGGSKQQSSEDKTVEEAPDFAGTFYRDLKSNFRKNIRRIKTSQSEPIMFGKILARTGSKRIPFVADTGCSVNILLARFVAAGGLRWRELDRDESTFVSVTNEELTIIGRTTAFIKLDVVRHPVKMDFLV